MVANANEFYNIFDRHRDMYLSPVIREQAHNEWLQLINKVGRPLSDFKVGMELHSRNTYDHGYSYTLTKPIGQEYREDFKPVFTPQEMLELGVFEGKYLNDDVYEYPKEWFLNARVSILHPDPNVNCMSGHTSRQLLTDWEENGWILTDSKGWFQWFCRYYLGRRLGEEDDHQINRWKAFNRHAGQIRANCTPGDLECRPRQRQGLLQWSYDYKI